MPNRASNEAKKSGENENSVQVWFRAPRIWVDFLAKKAVEEYCTNSDLLRHAFLLAYGPELKEFRVGPDERLNKTRYRSPHDEQSLQAGVPPSDTHVLVSYHIESDPWFESMSAFVANKRSPQTNRAYRLVLNQFFSFVARHPSDVKQSDIIRYRHQLEQFGSAPSSINQHLAAISGYYNFCISRGLTLQNPVKGVNRPPVGAFTGASWLSKTQAKALLLQPDLNTVKGRRDYAIILTMLLTGLRRAELSNIRRGDIEQRGEKLYLSYTCKGGTKTVRDIPRRCWEAVENYLVASGRQITDESPLFTSTTRAGEGLRRYYGKNGHNGTHPLTPEAIRQMINHYSRRAFSEEVRVSPHTLRHTAGTLLRKSGRSIEEVQSFLKHKRIDTTRRYLHVVEAEDSEFGECIARMLEL
ncbi:MAG: tyrosine-type recombinase/integrase [Dehalococcoidales bacterium]|nr:tyrosine-type recombinase/integrase [Dehalococcoidales bacterium]